MGPKQKHVDLEPAPPAKQTKKVWSDSEEEVEVEATTSFEVSVKLNERRIYAKDLKKPVHKEARHNIAKALSTGLQTKINTNVDALNKAVKDFPDALGILQNFLPSLKMYARKDPKGGIEYFDIGNFTDGEKNLLYGNVEEIGDFLMNMKPVPNHDITPSAKAAPAANHVDPRASISHDVAADVGARLEYQRLRGEYDRLFDVYDPDGDELKNPTVDQLRNEIARLRPKDRQLEEELRILRASKAATGGSEEIQALRAKFEEQELRHKNEIETMRSQFEESRRAEAEMRAAEGINSDDDDMLSTTSIVLAYNNNRMPPTKDKNVEFEMEAPPAQAAIAAPPVANKVSIMKAAGNAVLAAGKATGQLVIAGTVATVRGVANQLQAVETAEPDTKQFSHLQQRSQDYRKMVSERSWIIKEIAKVKKEHDFLEHCTRDEEIQAGYRTKEDARNRLRVLRQKERELDEEKEKQTVVIDAAKALPDHEDLKQLMGDENAADEAAKAKAASAKAARAKVEVEPQSDVETQSEIESTGLRQYYDDMYGEQQSDTSEQKSKDLLVTTKHLHIGRNPEPLPIRHQDLNDTLGLHLGRLRPNIARNAVITGQRIDMTMVNAYTIRPRFFTTAMSI